MPTGINLVPNNTGSAGVGSTLGTVSKKWDNIFAGTVIGFEIPKERAVDIDDILDFQFAEFLYNKFNHAK